MSGPDSWHNLAAMVLVETHAHSLDPGLLRARSRLGLAEQTSSRPVKSCAHSPNPPRICPGLSPVERTSSGAAGTRAQSSNPAPPPAPAPDHLPLLSRGSGGGSQAEVAAQHRGKMVPPPHCCWALLAAAAWCLCPGCPTAPLCCHCCPTGQQQGRAGQPRHSSCSKKRQG